MNGNFDVDNFMRVHDLPLKSSQPQSWEHVGPLFPVDPVAR